VELTEDQHRLCQAAAELAATFPDSYWSARDERHEFPWDFYNAFASAGWLGIAMPTEYGGGGLGITEASLVMEEIAASGAAMNGCSCMHLTIFGLNVIVRHASAELRKRVLPPAAAGELHVCFGVTEPDAGTDTTRITTVADAAAGGYIVNGRKVWITKAGESQVMVLLARTTARKAVARPTDGMSIFLVDLGSPGIEVSGIPKMGRNAVTSYEVVFEDVFVPQSARVGEEGMGFRYLLDGINPERILLAHEAVGIGRAALARACAYAGERVVFDRPIGSNQGISFPLAKAHSHLEAARLMARRAAQRYDRGDSCAAEANMAKFLCADASFEAADAAVQTLGGMGYAREYNVERYFREARLMRLAPVSQEMALNHIAHHVLGLPRSY
jgi:acyl-CoA dehydrogenase